MRAGHAAQRICQWAEGDVLKAYPDPASPRAKGTGPAGDPWTIGKGHTGPEVHEGLVWTQEQSDAAWLADMASSDVIVTSALRGKATTQYEFDAMTDMCFNVGAGNFLASTMLKLHLSGSPLAAAQFNRWHLAQGVSLHGLRKRCEARRLVYLGTDVEKAIKLAELVP